MMGKTHIAVGIASSYLLLQPKTPSQLAIATIGGSIGGIMADIDVKIERKNTIAYKASIDALYGEILAAAISLSVLVSDYVSGGTIIQTIVNHWQRSAVGAVLLVVLIVIGEISKHRDRTHSVLAMLVFSIAVF